jgi:hypothetical protein
MYFYVINNKATEPEARVIQFVTATLACAFVEEKLESHEGYELADFVVFHGKPMGLTVETRHAVYLTLG